MPLMIPENTPAIQITGYLIHIGETARNSQLAQILFKEAHMGIENKVHLLNVWNPPNFEECKKYLDKPVTVNVLKAGGDGELYRVAKGTPINAVKA